MPVEHRHGEDAQHGDQGDQVHRLVEVQLAGDQQQRAGQHDQQALAEQQAAHRGGRADAVEEAGGEGQGAEHGEQHRQVADLCLQPRPVAQPGRTDAEQAEGGDQQTGVHPRQPQAGRAAAVAEAHQVVDQQQAEGAEQYAEQQGPAVVAGHQCGGLDLDARTQGVLGGQAQVEVQRLVRLGQRQEEVVAGQRTARQRLVAAGVMLGQQLVATQHVEIELVQVGREDPQQMLLLLRRQAVVQPQRGAAGQGQLFAVDGIELIGVARAAQFREVELAAGVEQRGPLQDGLGPGSEGARRQRQQADEKSYGDPEPVHGEIPSVRKVSGSIIAMPLPSGPWQWRPGRGCQRGRGSAWRTRAAPGPPKGDDGRPGPRHPGCSARPVALCRISRAFD
ncbi:hypothetical protein D9M69_372490 [compost metagenome]